MREGCDKIRSCAARTPRVPRCAYAAPPRVVGAANHRRTTSQRPGECHRARLARPSTTLLWERVASRHNDDGSTSFITLDPKYDPLEFVVVERSGTSPWCSVM